MYICNVHLFNNSKNKNIMANKKQTQVQEQSMVITAANTQNIVDMLIKLNKEYPDFVKSTTQLKQHKQDIKQALNISDKVYISVLKAYKDNQIQKAKEDRDNDKKYLKEFEHTAKMVLQDMQSDKKYSTHLRDILKQYKDDIIDFMKMWCKEWDGSKFLTIHTLYNFDNRVIVRKYGEDTNLSYSKVYSLVSKCIDNITAARKAGIKDKEFILSKYTDGYIVEVCKFADFEDKTKRPTKGEKVDKVTDKMLSGLVTWSEYLDTL